VGAAFTCVRHGRRARRYGSLKCLLTPSALGRINPRLFYRPNDVPIVAVEPGGACRRVPPLLTLSATTEARRVAAGFQRPPYPRELQTCGIYRSRLISFLRLGSPFDVVTTSSAPMPSPPPPAPSQAPPSAWRVLRAPPRGVEAPA